MSYKIFVNDKFVEEEKAKISLQDTGFLFGYGLFETMRSYEGFVYKIEEHIKRLTLSAKFLEIPVPFPESEIYKLVQRALNVNALKNAYIKIILSGGSYSGNLSQPASNKPNFIIKALPFTPSPKSWYEKGIKATISSIRRSPSSPVYRHKSLNFLENLLARREARRKGFQEAIFLNTEGYLSEGSISNLFVVKKEEIVTPPLSSGILPGVTRKTVIDLCISIGIPCKERRIKLEELLQSEEAFLTNSLREILPLTKVDSTPIGKGKVGKTTKLLIKEYKKEILKANSGFSKFPEDAKH